MLLETSLDYLYSRDSLLSKGSLSFPRLACFLTCVIFWQAVRSDLLKFFPCCLNLNDITVISSQVVSEYFMMESFSALFTLTAFMPEYAISCVELYYIVYIHRVSH